MAKTVKIIYCRTFQGVLKIANYFMGYRMPRCIEGIGTVVKLPKHVKKRNIKHVLIVTDKVLLNLGLPNTLFESLKQWDIPYTVFSDIQQNPTDENVYAGYKAFKDNQCDAMGLLTV